MNCWLRRCVNHLTFAAWPLLTIFFLAAWTTDNLRKKDQYLCTRPLVLQDGKIRMSLRRKHWAWRQMRRLLTLLSDLLVGCASDRQGPPKAQHVSETNQTTNPGRMGCHFCPKAVCPHWGVLMAGLVGVKAGVWSRCSIWAPAFSLSISV